jgi:hypothetical protein
VVLGNSIYERSATAPRFFLSNTRLAWLLMAAVMASGNADLRDEANFRVGSRLTVISVAPSAVTIALPVPFMGLSALVVIAAPVLFTPFLISRIIAIVGVARGHPIRARYGGRVQ